MRAVVVVDVAVADVGVLVAVVRIALEKMRAVSTTGCIWCRHYLLDGGGGGESGGGRVRGVIGRWDLSLFFPA